MTPVRLLLAFIMTFVLSQRVQAQDWLLVDSDQIASESYLVLTVPLDAPEALTTVAEAIETQFGVVLTAEWPLQSIAVHCLIFDASTVADIEALITDMRADARIRTAQRMQGFTVSEAGYPDPLYPAQWSLDHMRASQAHLVSTGAGVRVGVVDSAIDSAHPDLAGRVVETRDFVRVMPVSVAEAHGTAVAGVIGADATNAEGMVGVAPGASLIGLRACWQDRGEAGMCNSFSLARAINFAILNGYEVINLSVGGPNDALIEELVLNAIGRGQVVVAASGEGSAMAFPASVPGVIAAGAGNADRVPAPMLDIITTAPESRHRYASGSSIAAAHVSGVVALLLAEDADLTADEITDALKAAVTDRGGMRMLDACKALAAIRNTENGCAP